MAFYEMVDASLREAPIATALCIVGLTTMQLGWWFFRKPGASVPWVTLSPSKHLTPLGTVLVQGGTIVGLVGVFIMWVTSDGRAVNDTYDRGMVALKKGDYDLAISCFDEAIQLDTKLAHAYINRGICYAEKGNHDKAIADFNEATRLEPKEAKAYNNRGSSYGAKGGYDKAIADFSEAIRLDPKYVKAYSNRAQAYRALGDEAKAASDERKAEELRK